VLGEHAAAGTDRVERVGLAARASLSRQPPDLEHPFATNTQKVCEARTERTGALNCETRQPTACASTRRRACA